MAPICTVSLESMRQGASSLGPATLMFVITSDAIALPRYGARSAFASRTGRRLHDPVVEDKLAVKPHPLPVGGRGRVGRRRGGGM